MEEDGGGEEEEGGKRGIPPKYFEGVSNAANSRCIHHGVYIGPSGTQMHPKNARISPRTLTGENGTPNHPIWA